MAKPDPAPMLDRSSRRLTAVAAVCTVVPLATQLPGPPAALMLGLGVVGCALVWRDKLPSSLVRTLLAGIVGLLVLWMYGVGMGSRFGRDTGMALLACALMLKLFELRALRDARSSVSYGLFAIMAAFLQDQGPRTLLLALASTIVAFVALARLSEVEHADAPPAPAREWRARGGDSLRLIALSIPLALIGFFLFPRLANPLWGLPQNSPQARTGLSDEMSPGDIAAMYVDETPVMRARFDGPVPSGQLLYWRGPILSEFDGRRWTRDRMSEQRAASSVQPVGDATSYELEQEPTDRQYIYALDMPTTIPDGSRLTRELTLRVRAPLTQVSRHRLVSHLDYRLEPDAAGGLLKRNLLLPADVNPRTRALAQQWKSENPEPRALIAKAMDLFNAEFTYTLEPGQLLEGDSIDDFLFNTRRGYCEHFASAFVVLMRSAGIPARVATGYQGGAWNPIGEYVVVRQSDAHAWAEVWIEGMGWMRVDPTSAVAPERIERGREALAGDPGTWGTVSRPLFDAVDWLRRGWNDVVLGFDASRQANLLRPLGIERATGRELAIALGIGLTLAIAATLAVLLRAPKDDRPPLVRAYAKFVGRLARAGCVKASHEGPRAFAERAREQLPAHADSIATLSERYIGWRYAGRRLDPPDARALEQDLLRFRVDRTRGSP